MRRYNLTVGAAVLRGVGFHAHAIPKTAFPRSLCCSRSRPTRCPTRHNFSTGPTVAGGGPVDRVGDNSDQVDELVDAVPRLYGTLPSGLDVGGMAAGLTSGA